MILRDDKRLEQEVELSSNREIISCNCTTGYEIKEEISVRILQAREQFNTNITKICLKHFLCSSQFCKYFC